ncbi:MAG: hypothetical protein ACOC3T_05170 [Bacteroidota bacterium]
MRKRETLEDMVKRRNKRLINLFTKNGITIRLVGDPQKPAIIKDENLVLSCFVKNFDLNFTREPFSDEIVKIVKLKNEPDITAFELEETLEYCTHRPVYKLRLTDTDMLLVGYNYLNSEDSVGRYPVFAKHKPKVYFDKEYAEDVAKSLVEEGYNIEIV